LRDSAACTARRWHLKKKVKTIDLTHDYQNRITNLFLNISDEAFGKLLESFPLALVTAGSSNGLAMSLGTVDAFEATKRIIEGTQKQNNECNISSEFTNSYLPTLHR